MRVIAFLSLLLAVSTANAETITAAVNGMVCAICVTGIEKSFQKNPAVEKVKVDLETGKVTVDTKAGATLDDATVTKTIVNAGYAVTEITRRGR
ncbi:MAG: heavy-metal-associated domain-containing protein [Rhodospirillaceae bacterium]|nr:heavy-metal-associated domain-containing protein [Rhodospirillaceae bacterium]